MHPKAFVTATGTDLGKTYLTAALVRHWRRAGLDPLALKPVQSGFEQADAATSDAGRLLAAMGRPLADLGRVAPWRLAAPLSPDMAAAREGRAVDLDALVAFCRAALEQAPGPVLVEGVGGVMVPLNERATVLDWITALGLPVILVAGNYLGTLSHTLTALAVLEGRGARVAAVVVNERQPGPVAAAETAASLRRHHAGPILTLPADPAPDALDRLCRAVEDGIARGEAGAASGA